MQQMMNQVGNVLHVRFRGRRFDLPLFTLGVSAESEEMEIRRAIAYRLEIGLEEIADYAIDRHGDGSLTLRPTASFV